MSADASAPAQGPTGPDDYDEMLESLDRLLDEAMHKVESGRVYDAQNERVRIKWLRVATQIIDTRRKVANDRTLEELSERIDALETQREVDS